jgi:hypothetical protein
VPAKNPFQREPFGLIDWGRLLFAFIVLLALLLFLGFYFYFSVTVNSKESWDRIKDASQVILPVITGTLGTVVAFYFGKRRD